MRDGDDEEGVAAKTTVSNFSISYNWVSLFNVGMLNRLFASGKVFRGKTSGMAYLSSAIPARALYHAMNAARSPKYPPAESKCWFGAPLASASRWPRNRKRNAMSRVKKSRKKATVERSVQISRMVVKMNQPARKKPKALLKSLTPTVVVAVDVYAAPMPKPGVRTQPMAIQKPPYEERAVAPKVFPTAISLFSRINMEINRRGTESYVPHASEQLNETSISESQCCDDIGLCDISVLDVNQR